jgi:chromate transporter
LIGTFAVLWAVPVGAVWIWRGGEDVLVREALFFTGAAFVTFGGAYAVLSYISNVAVNGYGWLTADQMVQGLGLAESTPGRSSWSPSTSAFWGRGTRLPKASIP